MVKSDKPDLKKNIEKYLVSKTGSVNFVVPKEMKEGSSLKR